jgi:hypothetical protein
MSEHLSISRLDDLVETLRAAGLRADMALEDLSLPGVWIRPRTVAADVISCGRSIAVDLVCIHGDTDARRAYAGLFDLFNAVVDTVDTNAGDARFVTVTPTDNPTPMPGLSIPYELDTVE